MKASTSLAVAPEACEHRLFPSLSFSLTEGNQILQVTKPRHSKGRHFFLLGCFVSVPFFTI